MHKRVSWCRRSVIAAACVVGALVVPAWGDPHFAIRTPQDWETALGGDPPNVRPIGMWEWEDYMAQWDMYLLEGEPYPTTEFLPAELYVMLTGGTTDPYPSGMVMLWGGWTPLPDGQYATAWKYDYLADPDLSNSMISLSVFAPAVRPGPNGVVKMNQISFGIQDINGRTRSWYWNCGPGNKIPWNVLVRVTIDCSQTGVNATSPPADSYMSNPAFDSTQSQFFIADENGQQIGGMLAIPPPPAPHPGIWNLWHDIVVMPRYEYKWQQSPDPAHPDDLFYGWNEFSEYCYGPFVADDWICTTPDPVTDVHWWGSFLGWKYPYPPHLPPHFHIDFWTDVPVGPNNPEPFSHPGTMVWEVICYNYTWEFVGWDFDPRTNEYESCFKFTQVLAPSQYFYQDPGPIEWNIYWLSIAACYD